MLPLKFEGKEPSEGYSDISRLRMIKLCRQRGLKATEVVRSDRKQLQIFLQALDRGETFTRTESFLHPPSPISLQYVSGEGDAEAAAVADAIMDTLAASGSADRALAKELEGAELPRDPNEQLHDAWKRGSQAGY